MLTGSEEQCTNLRFIVKHGVQINIFGKVSPGRQAPWLQEERIVGTKAEEGPVARSRKALV